MSGLALDSVQSEESAEGKVETVVNEQPVVEEPIKTAPDQPILAKEPINQS